MFRKIAEGDVFATTKDCATSGPRTAVLADGTIACTFMINSCGGANDFVPMITYSKDGGMTWDEAKPVWPELEGKKSFFASLRKGNDGRYSIAGQIFNIDEPGESFWSDEVGGMKENQVAFSVSDDGYNFPLPTCVDLPFYGSAEQAGGMLIDENGDLTMIYSPYLTIELRGEVDLCCMVKMTSKDNGATFEGKKFAQVPPPSTYAESWITRLTNGNLFVSTWQTASENSNQWLLSTDDGATFKGPFAQPFRGQSTGISPWNDGSVLIAYNQRKQEPIGVWLAMEKPDENGVNMVENEPVWQAETATKGQTSGDFSQWTDFSFGEPHVTVLPDDTLLVTLWYKQGDVNGIRYVHLVRE
jgi:hypothetical protein